MRKGFKASKYSLIITLVFCTALLLVFTANAATEGEYKPLNYTGACLTTINDNTSTTGESIVNSSNVPTNPTIKIIFDKNIASDSVWDINRQCFTLRNTAGSNVPIDVFRISDEINFNERRHVFITPLNNLSPGKTYKIIVSGNLTAKNGVKMGQDEEITFATAEAPDNAAPAWPAAGKLTASNVTQNSLSLSWNAATDNKAVTAYRVYRGSTLLCTATGTSFNASGLNAATQYTFKVEAGDAAGNWSTDGPSVTVTTAEASGDIAPPSWPLFSCIRVADITQTSLTLSWNAARDNVGVTGYRIYQNGVLLGVTDITTFNVTGLSPNTRYSFKVEAGDAAGNWSTDGPKAFMLTPAADTKPPVWSLFGKYLRITDITQTSLTLSWSAARDNVGVTGYRIYQDGVLLGVADSTTFNVTGLSPSTRYSFKVEAGDAAGNWSTDGPRAFVLTPAGKTSKTLAIYTETTGNGIFFSADNSGAFESPRVWPLYGYF